jgi:NADP-dependent 3-hydroxy acid dehydrogenase YdfG
MRQVLGHPEELAEAVFYAETQPIHVDVVVVRLPPAAEA